MIAFESGGRVSLRDFVAFLKPRDVDEILDLIDDNIAQAEQGVSFVAGSLPESIQPEIRLVNEFTLDLNNESRMTLSIFEKLWQGDNGPWKTLRPLQSLTVFLLLGA